MVSYLYEWIRNIAGFMILVNVVIHLVPNDNYRKYIRFFTGIVLILLVASPLFQLSGIKDTFAEIYESRTYEAGIREIEESTQYLNEIDLSDYFPEDEEKQQSEAGEVEKIDEIQIGH